MSHSAAWLARFTLTLALATSAAAALASEPVALDPALARRHQLESGTRQSITIRVADTPGAEPRAADGAIDVTVSLAGSPVVIHLEPHDVRAPGFTVLAESASGARPVPVAPPRTYRGHVLGRPEVRAAATVDGGELRARLTDGTETWWLEPVGDGSTEHLVYRSEEVLPLPGVCVLPDGVASAPAAGPDADPDAIGGDPGCGSLCQIAIDVDPQYAGIFDTLDEVVADIEGLLNVVDAIYADDLGITYEITTIHIHGADETPYSTNDPYALLDQFAALWNTEYADVVRDVAHLFTGRELSGAVIGIAQVAAICTDEGYGISQSFFGGNYAQRVTVTTHELGHNWSALHCNGDADCQIMCASVSGCTSEKEHFGRRSLSAIAAHRATRTCLDDGGPVAPSSRDDDTVTLIGEPVDVDVLANDFSVTCAELTITAFDVTTEAGGTVARHAGGGEGGRDVLTYVPPAGYEGTDRFGYVIVDDQALEATARVRVDVLEFRDPDAATERAPGLAATYYAYPRPFSAPDLDAFTAYASDALPELFFRRTLREVGTSGRMDEVGARIAGTIVLDEPGTYTWFVTADDGARVSVDGVPIVESSFSEASGSLDLEAGEHALVVEYYEIDAASGLSVELEGPSRPRAVVATDLTGGADFAVSYYALPDAAWLPDFTTLVPLASETVPSLFRVSQTGELGTSGRADLVAAQYVGFLEVPVRGVYRVWLESDDGSALWIHDRRIVVNDGGHLMRDRGGWMALEAGAHPIRVDYFQKRDAHGLIARIESDGLERQVIPADWLSQTDVGTPILPPGDGSDPSGGTPSALSVGRVTPNPFSSITTVEIAVPGDGRAEEAVRADVHDAAGRRVVSLAVRPPGADGVTTASWDGRDSAGHPVAPGVYFLRVRSGSHQVVRPVRLTR